MLRVMKALAVALSIACASGISALLPAQQPIDPAVAERGEGFISGTAEQPETVAALIERYAAM